MVRFVEKRFLPKRTASPAEKDRLIKAIMTTLSGEPEILFSYLHGSFITENAFRDIDVAVYTGTPRDFSFESDLSYTLSRAVGYETDVKVLNEAPVAFQMSVLRDGNLILSNNENARTDFIENVGRRYREYAHFRNIFMEALRAER